MKKDLTRKTHRRKTRGQVIAEYTMVIGVVVMVLMAMSVMIKRGLQGMVKVVADQVGNQKDADQKVEKSGYLVSQYTSTRMSSDAIESEFLGVKNYIRDDTTQTITTTVTNLGFTVDPI
ncbi:MAG TPA: hypothetical protein PKV41_02715 [Candidatus Omnitrophota bacterium]|nr:hypothetical protein [Candidatus Omnitrophota bacterium]